MEMKTLTGKFYFKKTFFGLILMVECLKKRKMPDGETIDLVDEKIWTKATQPDLEYLKLNSNI